MLKLGNIKYIDYQGISEYPKICIIAGVHGNEPAAPVLLKQLIDCNFFKKYMRNKPGTIRIIPAANEWGLKYGTRYQFSILHPDINRNFGRDPDFTAQNILALMQGYDYILDFHEGWGFHLISPSSIGSTISPNSNKVAEKLAEIAAQVINGYITEPSKKFIVRYKQDCDINTTLGCRLHRTDEKINYLLIETTGQNNAQPISYRMSQAFIFIIAIIHTIVKFHKLNMNSA